MLKTESAIKRLKICYVALHKNTKQPWNLGHLLSCFDWLHTNCRELHFRIRYIDHMASVHEKGSKSFCSTFLRSSLSKMHAKSCYVNDWSSLWNIITLSLYSKQTSRWRLQKEMSWLHPARWHKSELILETNFWNFKNMNTVKSTHIIAAIFLKSSNLI